LESFKIKYGKHLQSSDKVSKPGTAIKCYPAAKNAGYTNVNLKAGSIYRQMEVAEICVKY
jgi:hypothetical protein